jgi:hypothetical protein
MAQTLDEMSEATRGFDFLFANQLSEARAVFGENEHPFHLMGRGVCAFLQAALGMEVCKAHKLAIDASLTGAQEEYVPEAVRALGAADAGAKKMAKSTKGGPQTGRFPAGLEWEVVSADTTILNGVTNVLRYTRHLPAHVAAGLIGPQRDVHGISAVLVSVLLCLGVSNV